MPSKASLLTLLLFLFTSLSVPARADVLVEPYLGYHTGSWERGSADESMSGPTYGFRVGYQNMGLMLGIDYFSGMWKDSSDPKNDVTPTDLGLFVGYNFPVMLRLYGVFSPEPLNPTMKFKATGASSKYEGSSMKIGLGYMPMPKVSLNFEMHSGNYDELNGSPITYELKTTMYGLTVSLPLTF